MDGTYYVSHGGMIPVKWTAPEVYTWQRHFIMFNCKLSTIFFFTEGPAFQEVLKCQ